LNGLIIAVTHFIGVSGSGVEASWVRLQMPCHGRNIHKINDLNRITDIESTILVLNRAVLHQFGRIRRRRPSLTGGG
jgi:hypothetical protein